jgi:hypothetical protein
MVSAGACAAEIGRRDRTTGTTLYPHDHMTLILSWDKPRRDDLETRLVQQSEIEELAYM